jgi:hypothetical protein
MQYVQHYSENKYNIHNITLTVNNDALLFLLILYIQELVTNIHILKHIVAILTTPTRCDINNVTVQ